MPRINANDLALQGQIEALRTKMAANPAVQQAASVGFSQYLQSHLAATGAADPSKAVSSAMSFLSSAPAISSQAQDWIGKNVLVETQSLDVSGAATTHQTTGLVQGVYVENGQTYLSIDGNRVDMAAVRSITELASSGAPITSATGQNVLEGASLIGKQITAQWTGADGQIARIEGIVTQVLQRDGAMFALVNGTEVDLRAIQSISGGAAQPYTQTGVVTDNTANYPYELYPVQSPFATGGSAVGGVVMENTYSVDGSHTYTSGQLSLQELLTLIANDPALLTDGEFEIYGEPDEFGAYG